ncbi:unnamed protein product [Lathyrus sativus]|nr:unnamed protein product [Lathyrus sativus]
MDTLNKFSRSTCIRVNPFKCKTYFEGVVGHTKEEINKLPFFIEGSLPLRYLGVPLTSKKTVYSPLYELDKQNYGEDQTLECKTA